MAPFDLLDRALGIVVPDDGDDEADPRPVTYNHCRKQNRALRRWRATMGLITLGLVMHVAWACGLFPGAAGFAMASEVDKVREQVARQIAVVEQRVQQVDTKVDSLQVELLDQRIFETRVAQCAALKRNESSVAQLYGARVEAMRAKYRALTGREYQLTPCGEL